MRHCPKFSGILPPPFHIVRDLSPQFPYNLFEVNGQKKLLKYCTFIIIGWNDLNLHARELTTNPTNH